MSQHLLLGKKGEELACQYITELNYKILDINWRFKKAEIDIIARDNRQIIFIEVKTRSGQAFGQPEDFVHIVKQKLMIQAAEEYIYFRNYQGEIRFDIISILFESSEKYTLRHIEDAFWHFE